MHEESAYLLHRRPFSDSSEILYYLTKNHGLLHVLAKGSKKNKSSFKGHLQTFLPTCIGWQGKSDLKTLTQAEQTEVLPQVPYNHHVAMLYLNELLMLLRVEDSLYQSIHTAYEKAMIALLSHQYIARVLRQFEWSLCCLLGYQLSLPEGCEANDFITFDPQNGLVMDSHYKKCQAEDFSCFINGHEYHQRSINWLMRQLIQHITHGKKIKSRELWS